MLVLPIRSHDCLALLYRSLALLTSPNADPAAAPSGSGRRRITVVLFLAHQRISDQASAANRIVDRVAASRRN
jgi:hypothetical protein